MTAYRIVSDLLLLAGFIGCAVFIFSYRPLRLGHHGRAGRHMLVMTYCLAALFGLSLIFRVWDAPQWFAMTASIVVVTATVGAVWQRVLLHRYVKRQERREP